MTPPAELLSTLLAHLERVPRLLVAYSGGVDSTLLAAAAMRTHEPQDVRMCLSDSPSLSRRELLAALQTASAVGFDVHVLHTHELSDERYASNPHDRCFFCKSELFDVLLSLAAREGFPVILEGTNASDLCGHRPSRPAAESRGIRSPLAELGITKEQVRGLARLLHVPVAEKPASACLASRVPTGVAVTAETLAQIEQAEEAMYSLGFTHFRVRHHQEIARIELPPEDFDRALQVRQGIIVALKNCGYRHVTIDLAGYAPSVPPMQLTISRSTQIVT